MSTPRSFSRFPRPKLSNSALEQVIITLHPDGTVSFSPVPETALSLVSCLSAPTVEAAQQEGCSDIVRDSE